MSKLSEEYPVIYHYTSEFGVYGILESQSLWATHFKFLNDTTELLLFKDKLIKYLEPVAKKYIESIINEHERAAYFINELGGVDKVAKDEAANLVEMKYKVLFELLEAQFFVTSFCAANESDAFLKRNGLLSQWRGYGGDGGYAIEFDTGQLEKRLVFESLDSHVFDKCIYSDDDIGFKNKFSGELESLGQYLIDIFNARISNSKEVPSADKVFSAFLNCFTCFKHEAFKEECEVRIVAILTASAVTKDKLNFRKHGGRLIPYVDIFNKTESRLPVNNIIVGPHKDKEYRARSLELWLRNKGLNNIGVIISDIPYI